MFTEEQQRLASLANVLFGTFGQVQVSAGAGSGVDGRTVRTGEASDIGTMLAYSRYVIIVPGFGQAEAQAQHAVRELADVLKKRGVEVFGKGVRGAVPLLADTTWPLDADAREGRVAVAVGNRTFMKHLEIAIPSSLLAAREKCVALGSQGLTAAATAADAVLLSTDIHRVVTAVRLGRHVMRVALQGIWIGMGLSVIAMLFASFGLIPPAIGAILQEGVDVIVILNALRAGRMVAAQTGNAASLFEDAGDLSTSCQADRTRAIMRCDVSVSGEPRDVMES